MKSKRSDVLNVALVQTDIAWECPDENQRRIEALVADLDLDSVDLLVLPEMFASGFTMTPGKIATSLDGPVLSWVREFALRNGVGFLGSFVESVPNGSANTAFLIGPDGALEGVYRKIHPFAEERNHYLSGEDIWLFNVGPFCASVFICYDLRFPEVFRAAVSKGAQLFFVVANWPAARQEHWSALLRARAIENQSYVCGCNRTGTSPDILYRGGSTVIRPNGEIDMQMDDAPQAKTISLHPTSVEEFRERLKCLADRRPEIYKKLFSR